MPTQDELKRLFYYNPKNGKLYHRVSSGGQRARARAGHDRPYSHSVVRAKGQLFLAHRVIWTMVCGPIPIGLVIDHIDGNPQNNRLENLRLVTQKTNSRNCRISTNNRSGHLGVYWDVRDRKWFAEIGVDGRKIKLGSSTDKEAVVALRKSAERKYGFHPNHGAPRIKEKATVLAVA